jgi:hypothetical protein
MNIHLLLSFAWYCIRNPHQRFWQALRNWSGACSIAYVDLDSHPRSEDTFFWTQREGP